MVKPTSTNPTSDLTSGGNSSISFIEVTYFCRVIIQSEAFID
jgi:hypothetical protein